MQFANYFFASLISYLGLLVGIALIKIAPEEQKPLARYFVLMRRILPMLIFLFVMLYYYNIWFYTLALSIYLAFFLFVELKPINSMNKSMIIYGFLGIIFYLSSKNQNLFMVESSLIFIFGMPASSLTYNKSEKNHFSIFLYNLTFLIMANLLYFL